MTKYESLSLFAAYLNLLASFGGLGLLYYGIRMMAMGAEMRAADSESKHTETMTASQRRHDEVMAESERRHDEVMTESERRYNEFMADSRRREEEGIHRHEEAMEDIRSRDEEGLHRHKEAMTSLRELIDGQARKPHGLARTHRTNRIEGDGTGADGHTRASLSRVGVPSKSGRHPIPLRRTLPYFFPPRLLKTVPTQRFVEINPVPQLAYF